MAKELDVNVDIEVDYDFDCPFCGEMVDGSEHSIDSFVHTECDVCGAKFQVDLSCESAKVTGKPTKEYEPV